MDSYSTDDKDMITITKSDGSKLNVEVITYLISDDGLNTYLVYSKGELVGADGDEVIYISRIGNKNNQLVLEGISDDKEWGNVQTLLKRIANA